MNRTLGWGAFGSLLIAGLNLAFGDAPFSASMLQRLDQGVTPAERRIIEEDFRLLSAHRFSGQKTRWFSQVFSGNSPVHVQSFVSQRVRVIYGSQRPLPLHGFRLAQAWNSQDVDSGEVTSVADNLSSSLWLSRLAGIGSESITYIPQGTTRRVNIPIRASQSGVIQLRPAFTMQKGFVSRSARWIHEARHSDCPEPISPSSIRALQFGELPDEVLNCGFHHGECPMTLQTPDGQSRTHPYAGLPACDATPWGASAVEFLYLTAIKTQCSTCHEKDRQEAQLAAVDNLLRVHHFAGAMFSGQLGSPKMR